MMCVFVCNAVKQYHKYNIEKLRNSAAINAVWSGGETTLPYSTLILKRCWNVRFAIKHSLHIAVHTKNIVLDCVTINQRRHNMMDYYNRLVRYRIVMSWLHSLLSKSIISKTEYTRIDTMMMKKYGISSCSIFHWNLLTFYRFRVNMVSGEVLLCIEALTGNIVHNYVTIKQWRHHMTDYNKLFRYQTVMAWLRSLLSKSIISKAEYTQIDTMMLKKTGISSCSIFR